MRFIGITLTILGIILVTSEPSSGLATKEWFMLLSAGAMCLNAGFAILSKTIKSDNNGNRNA
jgi:hypothetical protein